MRFPIRLLRAGAIVGAALMLCGCVTRGYKLADKNTPPSVALNLSSAPAATPGTADANAAPVTAPPTAAAPVEAVVRTVIVYQGPGSWKREAYWDEYVITVTNRGEAPLFAHGATLVGLNDEATSPGEDPWKLERVGKTWWQSNAGQQTKTYLLLGGGTIAGFGTVVASVFAGGGIFAPLTGGAAVAAGVGTAAVVALPLVAVGSVGMNIHRKHQVEAEFKRRRLVLPRTLAPGESMEGSLFFRATPGPRTLTIHTGTGDTPRDVTVSLAPLASLHLRMPIVPAAKP